LSVRMGRYSPVARGNKQSPQGPGFILIEGASQTARYRIDGCEVKFPYDQAATSPLVISTGRHVIEVHEGEIVALREEIVLETGETRTRRVEGAQPE
jgi:hypothetical protein